MFDLARFLVTGGNGMIGRALPFGLKPTRQELDVTDEAAVRAACDRLKPAGIIALSSLNLRQCEADPLNANRVNVLGAWHLALEAARKKIPFAMVSSGAVFYGERGTVFDESSQANPVQHYGLTKRLAEILALQTHPQALIVRTGWLFGGSGPHHVNFADRALELAHKGAAIRASDDQEGSPTLLADFIQAFEELLRKGQTGVVHVANAGGATAAAIAGEIVHQARSASVIEPFSALSTGSVARSPSEVLRSRRLTLRPWQEALTEFMRPLKRA